MLNRVFIFYKTPLPKQTFLEKTDAQKQDFSLFFGGSAFIFTPFLRTISAFCTI
jgi:hypothetical protein